METKEYVDIAPLKLNDPNSFQKIKQKIEKFNARVVKSQTLLGIYSQMLSEAIDFTRNTIGKTILCFDVEVLERCHRFILEIGWSLYKTNGGKSVNHESIVTRHFIVQENLDKRNGRFVPDHKHLFSFGNSELRPLKWIIDAFIKDLQNADCVIGHSLDSDFKFLHRFLDFNNLDGFTVLVDCKSKPKMWNRNQKSQLSQGKTELYSQNHTVNSNLKVEIQKVVKDQLPIFPKIIKKFDTMYMTSAILRDPFNHSGLKRALQLFESTRGKEFIFHNAGNDAHATMRLFLALVSRT